MANQKDVQKVYEDIRNNAQKTAWAVFQCADAQMKVMATGIDQEEFCSSFSDDSSAFGYIRVTSSADPSLPAKFALITWCGPKTSPLTRAKLIIDKALMMQVIQECDLEHQANKKEDLEDSTLQALMFPKT